MNITRPAMLSISIVLCGLTFTAQADDVPSLIRQLSSWNTDKAKKASDELAAMGKPVVPELAKALSSKNRRRGRFAARTLRQMGQDAADAIPALRNALKDSDALTREYTVEALAKMLRQADQLIPVLQDMAEDENEDVRKQARLAVARLSEALESRDQATPALQPATETQTALKDNSVTPDTGSTAEKEYSIKLSPMLTVRCAIFMFVPVGFFSLLYFYREQR